jgi:hypothetical protein
MVDKLLATTGLPRDLLAIVRGYRWPVQLVFSTCQRHELVFDCELREFLPVDEFSSWRRGLEREQRLHPYHCPPELHVTLSEFASWSRNPDLVEGTPRHVLTCLRDSTGADLLLCADGLLGTNITLDWTDDGDLHTYDTAHRPRFCALSDRFAVLCTCPGLSESWCATVVVKAGSTYKLHVDLPGQKWTPKIFFADSTTLGLVHAGLTLVNFLTGESTAFATGTAEPSYLRYGSRELCNEIYMT